MLESSGCLFALRRGLPRWGGVCVGVALLAGCATEAPRVEAVTPSASAPAAPGNLPPDPALLAEEARAVLAQAETDVQRARSQRVLWTRSWEALLEARAANEKRDPAGTIRWARLASEYAQLGLEQAAYPAVR
jgi:hypothetical protein